MARWAPVASANRRRRLLLALGIVALVSWFVLDLKATDLIPSRSGFELLQLFLRGALKPAVNYEADYIPEGTAPLLLKVAHAAKSTVIFAAGGMSLALLIGLVLGFLGATSWWPEESHRETQLTRCFHCWLLPALYGVVRFVIAGMRSVHELLWALLFLAALGLNSFAAVLAIAIPYGGTLAKVFSEMLDETPRDAARSLRAIGARPTQVFMLGLLPQALPDGCAYAFYRFECAVRSSAVLGFFGYPTFGYYIRLSAENLHYREVWTYLYALFAVVLVLELWSAQMRRRIVMR